MHTVSVDGTHRSAAITSVVSVLARGGVVAVPTDTLYGLAVDPTHAHAVQRLFHVKGRRADQAVPLVAASRGQVEQWMGVLRGDSERLAGRFWPGPLTLVLPRPLHLARGVADADGTVAVRVPHLPLLCELCDRFGHPLTATSANRSGQPPTDDPAVVARELGDAADVVLDGGRTPGGPPSTIVDVTTWPPRLVREGATPWSDVLHCLRSR